MKSFYSSAAVASEGTLADIELPRTHEPAGVTHIRTRARIAVYEALSAAPRVIDIEPAPVKDFIEAISSRVHELSRSEGGSLPYTVIREVVENLIHADFAEPVVSILDAGTTIRFADQGPGIQDKERALLPGYTTASGHSKSYIRGVGSGLPIVRDYLTHSGGSLSIEDNLGAGSVVTVYEGSSPRSPASSNHSSASIAYAHADAPSSVHQSSFENSLEELPVARPRLSARQKHVLALVLESGLAGPSLVAKELDVGISTAYRDLALLEEAGLISSEAGKRTLTSEGLTYLGDLMHRS